MSNFQKTQPKLLKLIRYGIFLTAFIPLIIFSQFISPFHFGKAVVFRSLIEILAVFYIVLVINYGKIYLPPLTPLFWAITFFTIVFGITTLISINIYQSFFGTLERMGGWFSFLHFWGFFIIATAVLKEKNDWLKFIKISLFISLLSTFYGFLQKTQADWVIGSGGRVKIFGTIGNPALFAGYEIFNAFLALMLSFKPKISKGERYFYNIVFLLNSLGILLTGVRGSVLAVVIGIILFGFLYSFNFGSRKIKLATIFFLTIIIFAAAILYSLRNQPFIKNNQYLARYSDISPTAYTVQTRFWAWQAGFNGWNDSLKTIIFGWGPEMFNIPFSKYFNPKFFKGIGSETLFDRAHNQFLEVLFTMGLVGFTAYILIFITAFKNLKELYFDKSALKPEIQTQQISNIHNRKNQKELGLNQKIKTNSGIQNQDNQKELKIFKIGLIVTLIAYMIHNSFIFDTTANYLLFFITLGFINYLFINHKLGVGYSENNIRYTIGNKKIDNSKARGGFIANFVGVILAVLVSILIYYTNILPAKANYTTTRAIVASWRGNHDLAFEKFKEAMSFETFGKYEIRHRYAQYILENASKSKIDNRLKERLLIAAENVKKNVAESKEDYLPYLYLSRIYITIGKDDLKSEFNDLALENSLKALEISHNFVRTYYEIAQAYLNKKDYSKAIEWFEKAVKLNPEVQLSHWYLGITYAQIGEFEKGAEIIEKSGYPYKSDEIDSLRMVDIYLKMKNFKKVAEIYEGLVKLSPRNPQYYASLAVAYKEIGEREKAIKAALEAAKIDSKYAEEAELFIKSLK